MDYRLRFFGYYLWLFAFCASLDSGPHELIEMLLVTVAFVDYSADSWPVADGIKTIENPFPQWVALGGASSGRQWFSCFWRRGAI